MLTTREAARYLGISIYYLRNMRQLMHNHEGPPYVKKRSQAGVETAYYTLEALNAWGANHKWRKVA